MTNCAQCIMKTNQVKPGFEEIVNFWLLSKYMKYCLQKCLHKCQPDPLMILFSQAKKCPYANMRKATQLFEKLIQKYGYDAFTCISEEKKEEIMKIVDERLKAKVVKVTRA